MGDNNAMDFTGYSSGQKYSEYQDVKRNYANGFSGEASIGRQYNVTQYTGKH